MMTAFEALWAERAVHVYKACVRRVHGTSEAGTSSSRSPRCDEWNGKRKGQNHDYDHDNSCLPASWWKFAMTRLIQSSECMSLVWRYSLHGKRTQFCRRVVILVAAAAANEWSLWLFMNDTRCWKSRAGERMNVSMENHACTHMCICIIAHKSRFLQSCICMADASYWADMNTGDSCRRRNREERETVPFCSLF